MKNGKDNCQELWCKAEVDRDKGSNIIKALKDSKNRKASGLNKINVEGLF